MASRNICKFDKGFTLIEILVVVGVLIVIIAFGVVVDFSSFTSNTFYGEEAKIVSLLQKARSRAMANMYQKEHGVCYDSATSKYKIFKDDPSDSSPDEIDASSTIAVSGLSFSCSSSGIVFKQLTGNTGATATITITDGTKTENIIINEAGTINW